MEKHPNMSFQYCNEDKGVQNVLYVSVLQKQERSAVWWILSTLQLYMRWEGHSN